jgi:hypothetical protein
MKIVAMIGEPASGKTTIVREMMRRLSPGMPFKSGLVHGTKHMDEKIIVLGFYNDGDTFCGTDKFSMAAQPQVQLYIDQLIFNSREWNIFFEGDRLGNLSFLSWCAERLDIKVFVLECTEETKAARHKARNDTQTETFLKGRKTKISNIKKNLNPEDVHQLTNECQADISNAAGFILAELMKDRA